MDFSTPLRRKNVRMFGDMKTCLSLVMSWWLCASIHAQCSAGEVAITLNITTDDWPYETYWQITPAGEECSDDPLAEGSNTNIGCSGLAADNPPDGYGAQATITAGPFCLLEGSDYTLHFIDSYGDGGLRFEVYQNNIFSYAWIGEGFGNTWTFTAGEFSLPLYDSPCGATVIIENDPPMALNNEEAVALASEVRPPAEDCSVYGQWCEGAVSNTVWARFVPATTGTYRFSTCNDGNAVDTQLAVWKAEDCADFGSYSLITANDDAQGGCNAGDFFSSVAYAACLEQGSDYYIQIDGWNGATGNILLSVETVQANVAPEGVVFNAPCPADKGEVAVGSILPYLANSGSNFTSQWTGPNGFASAEAYLLDVPAGTYTWQAIDGCGAFFESTFVITEPEFWTFTPSAEVPLCSGSADGSLWVQVQGGTPPYAYQWLGPDFQSGDEAIDNLVEGIYQLTITDDNDCQYSQTYPLEASDDFTFEFGSDLEICLDESIEVAAPIEGNYAWQNGATTSSVIIEGSVWGIGNHALQLTVTSPEGCVAVDDLAFTVAACIGVQEHQGAQGIEMYPQPAESGILNVRLPDGSEWQFAEIYDVSGRMVSRQTLPASHTFAVEVPTASGVYALRLIRQDRTTGVAFWVK